LIINALLLLSFFTLGIKDPEGFGKKLEENCRSDHYSGQSSNTKESSSSLPLNRCTSTIIIISVAVICIQYVKVRFAGLANGNVVCGLWVPLQF